MGAGAFCNVCQIVITYFDNELLKNETLEELGDVLEKGCELLPTPFTGTVSWGGGGVSAHSSGMEYSRTPNTGLTPSFSFPVRSARGTVRTSGRAASRADDGPQFRLHCKCPRTMGAAAWTHMGIFSPSLAALMGVFSFPFHPFPSQCRK